MIYNFVVVASLLHSIVCLCARLFLVRNFSISLIGHFRFVDTFLCSIRRISIHSESHHNIHRSLSILHKFDLIWTIDVGHIMGYSCFFAVWPSVAWINVCVILRKIQIGRKLFRMWIWECLCSVGVGNWFSLFHTRSLSLSYTYTLARAPKWNGAPRQNEMTKNWCVA